MLKPLTRRDVSVVLTPHPETEDLAAYCATAELSVEEVEAIAARDDGPWTWCRAEVTVKWNDFEASAEFSCCSFDSAAHFQRTPLYAALLDAALNALNAEVEKTWRVIKARELPDQVSEVARVPADAPPPPPAQAQAPPPPPPKAVNMNPTKEELEAEKAAAMARFKILREGGNPDAGPVAAAFDPAAPPGPYGYPPTPDEVRRVAAKHSVRGLSDNEINQAIVRVWKNLPSRLRPPANLVGDRSQITQAAAVLALRIIVVQKLPAAEREVAGATDDNRQGLTERLWKMQELRDTLLDRAWALLGSNRGSEDSGSLSYI